MALTTILSWLKARKTATTFFTLLIGVFALFSWLKQAPIFLDGDPFYHAKVAQLMIEQHGIVKEFPWMPGSILAEHYYDHHLLYHVALIPFVLVIGDPLIAVRIATIFFGALFVACFYLLLRSLKTATPLAFTLLLLASPTLVARLNLDKAPATSLLVLFGGLYALHARKPIILAGIAFIYVWLYDAWPLLLVATFIWCYADACSSVMRSGANSFKDLLIKSLKSFFFPARLIPLAACTAGILTGIILNPYFPNNLSFFKTHLISIALVTNGISFGIGQEWFPADVLTFIRSNLLFFILWIGAVSWILIQLSDRVRTMCIPPQTRLRPCVDTPTLFFGMLSIIFFFYTLKSQRMAEYFIPFGTTFAALAFRNVAAALSRPLFAEIVGVLKDARFIPFKMIVGIAVVIGTSFTANEIARSYESLHHNAGDSGRYAFHSLERVGGYMESHLSPESIVATHDWSYFPQLLYYADSFRYLWGLDPTFTRDVNPEKYDLLFSVMKGEKKDMLAQNLRQQFDASYLLTLKDGSPRSESLTALLKKDSLFKKIYEDSEALLYAIR